MISKCVSLATPTQRPGSGRDEVLWVSVIFEIWPLWLQRHLCREEDMCYRDRKEPHEPRDEDRTAPRW